MDKTKIEQQAKKIMDNFLESLEEIEHLPYEVGSDRQNCVREEKEETNDDEFRNRMLNNAPKTKDNCIVAEKKQW